MLTKYAAHILHGEWLEADCGLAVEIASGAVGSLPICNVESYKNPPINPLKKPRKKYGSNHLVTTSWIS